MNIDIIVPSTRVQLKSNDKISAIFACETKLYVGLSNGDLQVYDHDEESRLDDKNNKSFTDMKVSKLVTSSSYKNVTKDLTSIEQIINIPDSFKRIIAIKSNSKLFIYELVGNHINLLYTFDESPTDIVYVEILNQRLLIFDSKKKLVFNEMSNKSRNIIQFTKIKEIVMKEKVKKLHLYKNELIVGLIDEFIGINLLDYSLSNISVDIPTSFSYFKKYTGTWMFNIRDDKLLLIKDTQILTFYQNSLELSPIKLERTPLNVIFIHPNYILLIFPKFLQILDLDGDLIQTFNHNNLNYTCSTFGHEIISLAVGSVIYQFKITNYRYQIDQFLSISGKLGQSTSIKDPNNDLKIIGIEKAISLVNSLLDSDKFFQTVKHRKQLVLRDLYKKKLVILFESYSRYHQSLIEIGSEWLISYEDVLPLFPDFLNGQIQMEVTDDNMSVKTTKSYNQIKQISVKDITNDDNGTDGDEKSTLRSFDFSKKDRKPRLIENFNKAVNNLIIYLTEHRRIHLNLLNGSFNWKGIEITPYDIYPNTSKENIGKRLDYVGSIIDTSLFLCYFYCKPMLLGPLLRLPNNRCNASVVNRCLLSDHDKLKPKFIEELLDFYYGRHLHKDALEMLYKLSHNENHGSDIDQYITPELTIQYLRKLSNEYLDLIFQFAYWVIDESSQKAEEYTRQIFMNETYECESYDNTRVMDFISQVLKRETLSIKYLEWVLFDGDLHEKLKSKNLLVKFHTLLALMYLKKLKHDRKKYEDDFQFINSSYYIKLYNFLKDYNLYEPFKVLKNIPTTDDAFLRLTIFIYKRLGEHEKSIDVLFNQLDQIDAAIEYCAEVYDTISTTIGINLLHKLLDDILYTDDNVESISKLLESQGSKMDILRVLTSLPNMFPLSNLSSYLEDNLRQTKEKLHISRLSFNLYKVGTIKLQDNIVTSKSISYPLDSSNQKCPICQKKLGYSVFTVTKLGQVVHFKCLQNSGSQPTLESD